MKKILSFLWIMATMFAVSCQKENEVKDEPLTFSSVHVGIADGGLDTESGTKSLISVDTEDFVDAYLFAFDASSKKILTYENGDPVSVYTNSKEFDWVLPIGRAIDIWVACNTGTNKTWKTAFNQAVVNKNLKESDLYGENVMFSCPTSEDLKALESTGAGIPMSGMMNNTTIATSTSTVTLTVKRLFAKYSIRVDASELESTGIEATSVWVKSAKTNTECPFFYNGHYAQTDPDKLQVIDRDNGAVDLLKLENGDYLDLYYLENCQGNKTGASSWQTVKDDLGSAVDLCSYVQLGVNYNNNNMGMSSVKVINVYLGKTDMKSNFDVQGNYHKKIKLNLNQTNFQEDFNWTNTDPVVIAPGSSKVVPFMFEGIATKDISFESDVLTFEQPIFITATTGTVRISASAGANEAPYDVYGGRLTGNVVKDKLEVTVKETVSSYYEMKIIRTTEDAESDGYDGWVRNPYFAYEILSRQKDTDIPDYYNDGGTTKSSSSLFIGESYGHETYGTNSDIEYIVFQLKTGVEYRIYPCSNTNAGFTGQSDAYYKPDNTYKTDYQNHPYFRIDFEYKNGSWSRRTDINLNSLSSPWKTAKAVRFKLKNISGEWNCIRQPAYNSFYSIKLIPLAGYTTNTYASGVYTNRKYIRETSGGTKYQFFGFTITTHQDPRTGAPQIPVISYDGRGTCTVNGSSKSITSIISSIQVYHNKNKTSWTSAIVSGIYGSGNFLGAHSSLKPDYSFRITSGNTGYMEGYGDVESYGMYSTWRIPLDWGRFGSKGSFEYSLVFKNVSGVADIPIHCDVLRPIASVKH